MGRPRPPRAAMSGTDVGVRLVRPPSRDGRRGGGAAQLPARRGCCSTPPSAEPAMPGLCSTPLPTCAAGHGPGSRRGGRGLEGAGTLWIPGPGRAVPVRSDPRGARRPRYRRRVGGAVRPGGQLSAARPGRTRVQLPERRTRSTCAWIRPGPPRPATWSMAGPKRISPGCFATMARPASHPGSPGRWSPARPIETDRRRWPRWCAGPFPPPPAARAATRPVGSSRRCGSPSTRSWRSCPAPSTPPWPPWARAGGAR